MLTTGNFDNPFNPGHPIGSYHLTQPYKSDHKAIDVVPANHSADTRYFLHATIPGIVKIRENPACGYGVEITSNPGQWMSGPNGVALLYCHLDPRYKYVRDGEYVQYGQRIGVMGNSGRTRGRTGIHLHYVLRVDGQFVNIANTNMQFWKDLQSRMGYNRRSPEQSAPCLSAIDVLALLFTGVSVYYVTSRS